jgi:hypothetical protein
VRSVLNFLRVGRLHACVVVLGCGAALATAVAAPSGDAAKGPVLGYSPENMDKRVSPRQDFYRYAVGNWLDRTGIPASEPDIGAFSQLEINLDQQLVKLIKDAAAANAPPGSPRQQIGDYWRAAMDLKRLDELGIKPLQGDLDRIAALTLPGSTALGELSGRLQIGYGFSPLVIVGVDTDAKNSSAYLLTISAGQQWLDRDEYAKPDRQRVRDLYLAYISSMMRSAGLSAQDAESAARTVLSIETEISAAQLTPLQSIDPDVTYNIMTLAEAQALIPALDPAAGRGHHAPGYRAGARHRRAQGREQGARHANGRRGPNPAAVACADRTRVVPRPPLARIRRRFQAAANGAAGGQTARTRGHVRSCRPAVLSAVEAVCRGVLPRKHAARHDADGGLHQG